MKKFTFVVEIETTDDGASMKGYAETLSDAAGMAYNVVSIQTIKVTSPDDSSIALVEDRR